MKNNLKRDNLSIAMIGHKMVPSRRGGIEVVLTTICPLIVERGHEVMCFNRTVNEIEDEYIGNIKKDSYKGVKLKKVITLNKKGLAAITSSFSAALCAAFGDYDIVHFHAEGPCVALWIPKKLGKRCIVTVHGLDWAREKWRTGFGSHYIKLGEKILAKYADEVIVLSKNVQQYFIDTYGRKTVFIPNGVSRPEQREAHLIISKYGLHKDDYICALSRLTEEKGIHYLIEAYNKVKTDKKLVIAGDTSDTDEYVLKLKKLASGNPNIIFTGFVSGEMLEELYSNAYVYVLPSNLEGMPLSLLEAMSYGNAVIGSDIPEIKDVIGDKGIIFKKSDIVDLRDKLQEICDNQKIVEKYKTEAADFICNNYDWSDVVTKTLLLYENKK